TNHLDITSKEILEDALVNYTGTILYVSHDRYFINKTATRILDLTNQTLVNYIGNYDYYLEKKEIMTSLYAAAPAAKDVSPEEISETKLDWKAQKEEQARLRKRQSDLKKTEDEIHQLETRDGEIDELLGNEGIFTDVPKLMELNNEKETIRLRLEELYELWEDLAE
ncbi:MAG TPA: ABC transporter, partial [Lachnoclostridium sp.]|nr:ABC transporter [Lachnoclostridium sp.]